jgi:two-component system sensor histidine kinase VicK
VIVSAKKINLNHIVDEVFKELALSADNKQITLSTKLPASPVIIKGDNLIVKEILINMVSNAIKYTPNGGQVLVQIRKGSRNVLISVKDNGMGIPKSAREQLFSKFYRAQNVVRHETSGTGLGLYLVKGLVETLNGKIWFESIENRGSTFYVRLPIEYSGRPITSTDAVEDLPILRAKRQ